MSEPLLPTFLLSVIVACLLAITVAVALTAREIQRTLRRINALLPGADRMLREAHDSLHQTQQLLTVTE